MRGRSLGTRVLSGVLCFLMMFEWPALAEGLGSSNWANHRAVGGDFNGMGWSSVLYQPLAGALHVGVLLSRVDGSLAPAVDWGETQDGLNWSGETHQAVVGDFTGSGQDAVLLQGEPGFTSAVFVPGPRGEHYQEVPQGPFSAIGELAVATHHLVVGDFTGNGRDDLFLQAVDPGGADGVALSGPHGGFRELAGSFDGRALGLAWSELATSIVAGDFSGDGRADLLLRSRGAAGSSSCCDLVRLSRSGMPERIVQSWTGDHLGIDWTPSAHRVVVGDLTGNGRDDLLLQPRTPTGQVEVLLSDPSGEIGGLTARWPAMTGGVDWSTESYELVPDQVTTPSGGGSVLMVPRVVGLPYRRAFFGPTGQLLKTETVVAPSGPYGPGEPGSDTAMSGGSGSISAGGGVAGSGSFGRMGMARATSGTSSATAETSSSSSSATPAVGTLPGQFAVSPTGAATYRIPIAVAPGVNGLEPHPALVYQAGTGGSQIGLGWSLAGFSEIARCPDTIDAEGYAASPDGFAADAYCLDGAHLIPDPGQTNGGSGTNYHTTIAAFRFITSNGGTTNGPTSFTVYTKSGLTETFGSSTGSSVGDPPAIWLLHEVTDRSQNFIEYHYVQNASLGSYRVSSIDYGNASGTTVGELVFNYTPLEAYNWILSCATGSCYVQHSMLTSIEVYSEGNLLWTYELNQNLPGSGSLGVGRPTLGSVTLCDAGGACYPATTFQYAAPATGWDAGGATTIAANVGAMHFGDFLGNGRTDFAYVSPAVSAGDWCLVTTDAATRWVWSCSTVGAGIGSQATVIDWQNNGTDGLIVPTASGFTLAAWNGTTLAPVLTRSWPGTDQEPEPVAADLTGSGYPDLVFKYNNQIWYFPNNGGALATTPVDTGFSTTEEATLAPFRYNHSGAIALYDGPEGCSVTSGDIPTGNTSSATCEGTVGALVWSHTDGGLVHEIMPYQGEIEFADLTGDGLDDEIANIGGQWEVFLNRGGSFDETPDAQQSPAGTVAAGPNDWTVADAYDSGRQDLLVPYTDGTWHALSWGGYDGTEIVLDDSSTGLSDAGLYPSLSHGAVAAVDVTGTGLGDLAWESGQTDTGETWTLTPHTAPAGGANGDLLTGITNGLGVTLTIGYGSLTAAGASTTASGGSPAYYSATPACSSTDTEVSALKAPIYVVKSLATDPVAGSTVTTNYQYGGACVDRGGRGFLGFSTRTVTNSLGYTTVTDYAMGFPYTGLVTSSTQTGPGGILLGSSTNTLAQETAGTNAVFPYVSQSVDDQYALANGALDRTVTTTRTEDAWGNATAITTTVANPVSGETHTTATSNTYTNDTQTHCLGRLTAATVTESGSDEAPMSRSSTYTYGTGSDCVLDSETFEPGVAALTWTRDFSHDSYGNVVSVTETGNTFASRTTTTTYDTNGRFVVAKTDALGFETTDTVNDLGEDLSVTGPNGETESRTYDGFGRLAGTAGPWPGASTTTVYAWCDGDCMDGRAAYSVTTSGAGVPTVTTDYDHHGRAIASARQVFGGQTVDESTYYDAFGRPYLTSVPSFAGSTPCWIWHGYDARGRVNETVSAANQGECTVSSPPASTAPPGGYTDVVAESRDAGTTTVDDNARTTVTVKGVLGHVLSVTDPLGGTTTYSYDAEGDLVAKKTPVGAVTTYAYDAAGHRIGLSSVSNGSWSYSVDALGELVGQTDPTGNTVTESYDLDGDLISRTVTDAATGTATTSTWSYGTSAPDAGRLIEVSNGTDYTRTLAYDAQGVVTGETTTIDGEAYTESRSYTALGQLASVTYPPVPDPSIYGVKPVAEATASPTTLTSAGTVTLDGSGSTDPDSGSTLGYAWSEVSGPATVTINDATSAVATVALDVNGTYVFELTVGDGYASDSTTVSVSVAIPPGVPGAPSVSPNPSATGEYTVSWSGLENVTSYNLDQSANGGSYSSVYSGSGTSWSPGSAEPNGTYGYEVQACNSTGCGALSGATDETVDLTPGAPGTPTMKDPAGRYPGGNYWVTWTPPSYGAVTAYNLEESAYESFSYGNTLSVSGPPVEETFGSDGATHWYRVQACHGSDCGAWSGSLEVIDPVSSGGGGGSCPTCGPSPKVVTAPTSGSTTSAMPADTTAASGSTTSGTTPGGSTTSGSTATVAPAAGSSPLESSSTASSDTSSSSTASPAAAAPPAPGGWQLVVSYVYDGIGDLTAVYGPDPTHPYWQLEGVDAQGQVTSAEEAGGADTVTRSYDAATGELLETGVEDGSGWILHQEYGYDDYGDRVSRQDLVTGESESYSYDADSRLVGATATVDGVTATTLTASYDGVGNLESKTGLGGTVNYTYGSDPDQVASVAVTGSDPGVVAGGLDYDAAGRMTAGLGLTVDYDGRGLAAEVTTGSGTGLFQYTPGGGLESEEVSGASGTEAVYEMDGGLVRAVVRPDGVDSYRESVVVGGEIVGILTSRSNGTSGFTYLYRGGLGSVAAYADAAGAEEGVVSYTPYGRLRSETDWGTLEPGESLNTSYGSREGFTGGQDLTSLGVEVLGARVYDPAYGRWLSPDPAGASASPYVYAGDDPETLTDPTGASSLLGDIVGLVGVALAAWGGWSLTVYEMGSAAYATNAAGAITSTLTTSAAVSAGAAGGFSGGFVGGMIGSDGNPEVGFEDGLFGAASGAAMGAIGGIDINGGLGGAVERGALEGLVNGTLSAAAGGSFRSGFIGGMVGSVGFYEVGGIKTGTSDWAVAGKVAMLSTVSGTVSALSGGSFVNGALSAAFEMMFNGIAHTIAQQEAQRRAEEAAYGEIGAYAREANGKSPPGLANAVASIGAVCARNGGGCNYNTTGPGSSGWNRQAWSNIVAAKGGLNESGGGNLMCVNTTSCVYVNYARTYQNGLRVWARRPTPLKLTGAVVIPNTAAGTLKLYFFHMPYHGWLNTSDYLNGPH